jgi:glycosyltransferase involved in cell wall biosynthesis
VSGYEVPVKDRERLYYLPLGPSCPSSTGAADGCGLCRILGCLEAEERNPGDLERSLERAQSGGHGGVLVPAGFLRYPHARFLSQLCRKRGLGLVLRIHASLLRDTDEVRKLLALQGEISAVEILFWELEDLPRLADLNAALEEKLPEIRWTYLPRRDRSGKIPKPECLEGLPSSLRAQLRFHLPHHDASDRASLTVREGYEFLEKIAALFPEIRVAPPEGREIWDYRISNQLGLEPMNGPEFELRGPEGANSIEFSVIIPSYDSGPLLKNTLRHLLSQDLARARFEIIVVDDGSGDGSLELIRNFVAPEAGNLNFRYFYFPRPGKREMGDGHFRAGIARNLGAKNSRGRLLCFLDADILVSPSHLTHLLEKHHDTDVIQCVRLHLKNRRNNDRVEFPQIKQCADTFVLEGNYWGRFFATRDWMALPFFWKYTCTYALSLPTELFHRVGRFRRTYVFYGFEDTDLGYRLARAGARFRLDPAVTIHQWSAAERSEYGNSSIRRHQLLSKTAKTFYLNTLDPEIFTHFNGFMRGERRAGGRISRWLRNL